MIKVGIIGHSADRFNDPEKIKRSIKDTLDLLVGQYGQDQVIFNINTDIGVGLWAGSICIEKGYRFNLFLPSSPEKSCEDWYGYQKEDLMEQYRHAHAITISDPDCVNTKGSIVSAIDSSNFIVCWWIGNKSGNIPDAITHAMNNNTMVLHALDHLRLITDKDISRRI